MKVLNVLCVILYFIGVYSDDARENYKVDTEKEIVNGENEECANKQEINLKEMFREMKTNKDFVPTAPMLCFAACLLKKNGLMNPDGSLTRKYNDSVGAKQCKNLTGRDECGAAYKIMDCLNKHKLLRTGEN